MANPFLAPGSEYALQANGQVPNLSDFQSFEPSKNDGWQTQMRSGQERGARDLRKLCPLAVDSEVVVKNQGPKELHADQYEFL